MNLKLNLVGTFVNSWPILTIKQGNKRHEYTVKGNTELDIDLADETFTLGMYNKSFGQNHVWDTVIDKQGNVVEDKYIQINRFDIDEVDVTELFIFMTYRSIEQGDQVLHDGVIRFNGCWKFDIPDGIPLNCIIEMRNRSLDDIEVINHFSDYTIRDKDEQYAMIEKIRDLFR